MVTLFNRESRHAEPVDTASRSVPVTPGIDRVVTERLVQPLFQPIVHLDSTEVVAYEALTRGPADTALERPDALFAAARAAGLAWELDTIARIAAFRAVLDAHLHPSVSVFVNADPSSVGAPVPSDLVPTMAEALMRLRVFLDVSEQALGTSPAATLVGIERARAANWGISLDNVGLTADSLALMPFARPDVVKVDVSLLHGDGHHRAPRVLGAVTAHRERTGAVTLAAGIESREHLRTARALGATYGQGYLFGRPEPMARRTRHAPVHPLPLIRTLPPAAADETPFQVATDSGPAAPAARAVVEALAADLEQRAVLEQDPPVFLACLPDQRLMSGGPLAYLQVVGRGASFAGAVCGDPPLHPVPGAHIQALASDDPLRSEWTTILIGPHQAVLLTARGAEADRSLAYRLTYDRAVVVRAARILMQRITR
jgi:EAL domain-containing protein (putative c-di-GMP-specific phosphodiesterase class I)